MTEKSQFLIHLRSQILCSAIRRLGAKFHNSATLWQKNKTTTHEGNNIIKYHKVVFKFFLIYTIVLNSRVYSCHCYYFSFFISLPSLSLLFVTGKRYTCPHVQKLVYAAARPQTPNCSLCNSQASLFPPLTAPLIPRLAFKPQVLLRRTYGRGMCYRTVTSIRYKQQSTISGMPEQDTGMEKKPP